MQWLEIGKCQVRVSLISVLSLPCCLLHVIRKITSVGGVGVGVHRGSVLAHSPPPPKCTPSPRTLHNNYETLLAIA